MHLDGTIRLRLPHGADLCAFICIVVLSSFYCNVNRITVGLDATSVYVTRCNLLWDGCVPVIYAYIYIYILCVFVEIFEENKNPNVRQIKCGINYIVKFISFFSWRADTGLNKIFEITMELHSAKPLPYFKCNCILITADAYIT